MIKFTDLNYETMSLLKIAHCLETKGLPVKWKIFVSCFIVNFEGFEVEITNRGGGYTMVFYQERYPTIRHYRDPNLILSEIYDMKKISQTRIKIKNLLSKISINPQDITWYSSQGADFSFGNSKYSISCTDSYCSLNNDQGFFKYFDSFEILEQQFLILMFEQVKGTVKDKEILLASESIHLLRDQDSFPSLVIKIVNQTTDLLKINR